MKPNGNKKPRKAKQKLKELKHYEYYYELQQKSKQTNQQRGRDMGEGGSTRTIFSGVFPLIMLMTLAAFGQNRRKYLSSHSPMTHCLHTLLSVSLSPFLPISLPLLLSHSSCLSQSLLTHAFSCWLLQC